VRVVTLPATVLSATLPLAMDAAAFTPSVEAALQDKIRSRTSCYAPACRLELRVAAGSFAVAAELTYPSTDGNATLPASTTALFAVAQSFFDDSNASVLSSALQVAISAPATTRLLTSQAMPLAVAPPPPPAAPPAVPHHSGGAAGGALFATIIVAALLVVLGAAVGWRRRAHAKQLQVDLRQPTPQQLLEWNTPDHPKANSRASAFRGSL